MLEEVRHSQNCYLSTRAHVRSFIGRFVYIYIDKGRIELTDNHLQFHGRKTKDWTIPLDSIAHVAVGRYSRLAKPIRLDYLAVTFRIDDEPETLYFTPTHGGWTPVWHTNLIVADWAELVSDAWKEKTGQTGLSSASF